MSKDFYLTNETFLRVKHITDFDFVKFIDCADIGIDWNSIAVTLQVNSVK